eukprot:6678112-Alexandrium_andersonii.AAC.1
MKMFHCSALRPAKLVTDATVVARACTLAQTGSQVAAWNPSTDSAGQCPGRPSLAKRQGEVRAHPK